MIDMDKQQTKAILDIIAKWISIDHLFDGTNEDEIYAEEEIKICLG